MRKQQGFTLIELVVVIIILGILAVVAAPKFLNLQSDARTSALQGLKGAILGANSLVYSKAALAGKEKSSSDTVTSNNGQAISIVFGYVKADATDLQNAVDINANDSGDWIISSRLDTTPASVTIWQKGAPTTTSGSSTTSTCQLTYTEAGDITTQPKVEIVDSGC